MRKPNFKILVCIIFISGCSKKIEARDSENVNAENITEQDNDNTVSKYS